MRGEAELSAETLGHRAHRVQRLGGTVGVAAGPAAAILSRDRLPMLAAGDERFRARCHAALMERRERGTLVMVSHDPHTLREMFVRVRQQLSTGSVLFRHGLRMAKQARVAHAKDLADHAQAPLTKATRMRTARVTDTFSTRSSSSSNTPIAASRAWTSPR